MFNLEDDYSDNSNNSLNSGVSVIVEKLDKSFLDHDKDFYWVCKLFRL